MSLTGHTPGNVLRVPGRLVRAATDLSDGTDATLGGGTLLGITSGTMWDAGFGDPFVPDSPYDGGSGEAIYTNVKPKLQVLLREWQDDTLDAAFSGWTATGASTAEKYVSGVLSASKRPGYPQSQATGGTNVVWLANDYVGHPSILIFDAIITRQNVTDRMSPFFEKGLMITCWAALTSSGELFADGKLADLASLI